MEDLAVSLERLAFTLDGQVFSPGAARLVQVHVNPKEGYMPNPWCLAARHRWQE